MFDNHCNKSNIVGWEVRLMLLYLGKNYFQELIVASCMRSIGCSPIETLVVQRVYKYIVKDKSMHDHKMSKQA